MEKTLGIHRGYRHIKVMKMKDKRQRPRKITRGNRTVPADTSEGTQCEVAAETRVSGWGGGGVEGSHGEHGTKPFLLT